MSKPEWSVPPARRIIPRVNSAQTRLRLFGPPVLSDADGTPVGGGVAQPHRIALLAFLALQPNRTATREELTAHLWSGLGQKEANQLLNRELFSINKALGDDAIFSNAREVRLGSRVTVDALDFQSALDAGRPGDRKSTRLNSSHQHRSRMPSSA